MDEILKRTISLENHSKKKKDNKKQDYFCKDRVNVKLQFFFFKKKEQLNGARCYI
jgi:hypothetical protein